MALRYRTVYLWQGHRVMVPDGVRYHRISEYGSLDAVVIDVRCTEDCPCGMDPRYRFSWSVKPSELEEER